MCIYNFINFRRLLIQVQLKQLRFKVRSSRLANKLYNCSKRSKHPLPRLVGYKSYSKLSLLVVKFNKYL